MEKHEKVIITPDMMFSYYSVVTLGLEQYRQNKET